MNRNTITAVALAATACNLLAETARAADAPAANATRARGAYLVTVTGCHDCHTPLKQGAAGPEPDMSRMLSGHPQSLVMTPAPSLDGGPWGVAISKTNTA